MLCYGFRIAMWTPQCASSYVTMFVLTERILLVFGIVLLLYFLDEYTFRGSSGHLNKQNDYHNIVCHFLTLCQFVWAYCTSVNGEITFVFISFTVSLPSDFSFNDIVSEQVCQWKSKQNCGRTVVFIFLISVHHPLSLPLCISL